MTTIVSNSNINSYTRTADHSNILSNNTPEKKELTHHLLKDSNKLPEQFNYIKADDFESLDFSMRKQLINDSANKLLELKQDESLPVELRDLANNISALSRSFIDNTSSDSIGNEASLGAVRELTNSILSQNQYDELLQYFIMQVPIKLEFIKGQSYQMYSTHKTYLDNLLSRVSKMANGVITQEKLYDTVKNIFDGAVKKQEELKQAYFDYVNKTFTSSTSDTIYHCINLTFEIHNNSNLTYEEKKNAIYNGVHSIVNVFADGTTASWFQRDYFYRFQNMLQGTSNYISSEFEKLISNLQNKSDEINIHSQKGRESFIDENIELFMFLGINELKSSKITLETLKKLKDVLIKSSYGPFNDFVKGMLEEKFMSLNMDSSLTIIKFNEEMMNTLNSIGHRYMNNYLPAEIELTQQQLVNQARSLSGVVNNEKNTLGLMLEMSASLSYLNAESAIAFSQQAERLNQLSVKLADFSGFLAKINVFYKEYSYGINEDNKLIKLSDIPQEYRLFFTKTSDQKSAILTKDSLISLVKNVSQDLAIIKPDDVLRFQLWSDGLFSSSNIEDLIINVASELNEVNEQLDKVNQNLSLVHSNAKSSANEIENMLSIYANQ